MPQIMMPAYMGGSIIMRATHSGSFSKPLGSLAQAHSFAQRRSLQFCGVSYPGCFQSQGVIYSRKRLELSLRCQSGHAVAVSVEEMGEDVGVISSSRNSIPRHFDDDEPIFPNEEHIQAEANPLDTDEFSVENFNLSPETVRALERRGIQKLFPIQAAVLRPAMEGRDIIGRARTGTGKTLAFALPIIERLLEQQKAGGRPSRAPKCIILAPTRELAKQVQREIEATGPGLRMLCCYGGVSIMGHQSELRRGVDIVVGTPGRMIDLMERGALNLSEVQFSILDEADQMLSVGFDKDVEVLYQEMPEQRTNYLFSATMPMWVKKLARNYLKDPVTVDLIGDHKVKIADTITMLSMDVPPRVKRSVLGDVLTVHGKGAKAIVFTQTKRECDEVAAGLGKSIRCEALHGDIAQFQREKTLAGFRDGRFSVMVATDVASRGLDIPNVDLVVHYEMPNDEETFLHRSGRTGRAGKKGVAVLLHSPRDTRTLRNLERAAGIKFQTTSPPSATQVVEASADLATEVLHQVDDALLPYFRSTAARLLNAGDKSPEDLLCAALAAVSGLTEAPTPRSLISLEEGWRTVMLSPAGSNAPIMTARDVMRTIGDLIPRSVQIGRIKITKDETAAVFDLPMEVASQLQQKGIPNMQISLPDTLPILQPEIPDHFGDRSGGILEEDDLKVEGGEVAGVEETVTRTEGKTTVLETGGAQDEEDMELLDHGLIEAVHGGVMMVEDGQNDEASEASLVIVDLGQRAHPVVVENSLLDLEVEEGVHLVGREEIVHLAVGRNRTSSLSIDLF
eukprot:CAMPEP_0196571834 /NCGR_PEP_ID=MMETSP1081-20130531/1964_1 /TAXON_ID=36882 /ORGANISM="Pyramimonas amylifera, Strain CCMP720" /LENGTH=792 /DNA_ID=CAMNT_0041888939 /DNA_START=242 /DNA_END=2621 /DNA_ORIENTATION=+